VGEPGEEPREAVRIGVEDGDPDPVIAFKGEMLSDRAIRELSGPHRLALLSHI